jgi:acyl-CoA reductase-like NAD-dependent aldehyde dehydrogenase
MPDVRALAFWMRKPHLVDLKRQFEAANTPGSVRLPRGIVFHMPPANVDTIFMYSWLLSALCGNRNIVRLPRMRNGAVTLLCETLSEQLATRELGDLIPAVAVVGYGHESEITSAISAHADVRVVWGGDATVARIREIALPPRALELTFADRY